MNDEAKLETSAIAAALALGILGDAILRSFPWGMNLTLWLCALMAAIVVLGRTRPEPFAAGGYWLELSTGLFSLGFLWRDSLTLQALDLLAVLTALSLLMLRAQGFGLRVASLTRYALGGIIAGLNAALGMFPLLFGNRAWKRTLRGGQSRRAVAVLCGTAYSILPVVIFGSLFMGADPVFRAFILRYLWLSPTHFVVIAIIAFGAGGYLRGLLLGKELQSAVTSFRPRLGLNTIEMGVMLGVLDLLFLAFVAVRVRYFFGGSTLVHATTGLTYAEYARRGFFELVTVSTLVLPFLLVIHWLLPADDAPAQRLYRWLGGGQIALLFVIMASAAQRMRLYVSEYGLSEARLYPTAFMGWLALVFVWFALTVLRGRRERFAFGAMVAGFLLVAVLQALNPDALIARTNLARAQAGHSYDARYAAWLSADAVPELISGLAVLKPQDRCTLASELLKRWSPSPDPDWRTWNYSSSRARQAVQSHAPTFRAAACAETKR
jgi:hypothetical protein